ncbi:MAG: hypothetical protein M3347_08770 [Armatimonadota bacterium]|nr:hypothetical protein [Armatimonadota bacterium]
MMRGAIAVLLAVSLFAPSYGVAQETAAPGGTGQATSPARTEIDAELINQLLSLLNDAVITKLDARVSLESLDVKAGRVRIEGLRLQNFQIGLLLKAKGARRLAETLQNRFGGSPNAPDWLQWLDILKLGLFNHIEVSVRLKELRVRQLALDADDLQVEGLLLQVGATPPDPVTGKPRSDTLQTLLQILRHTALTRIKAHAGLDKLAAKRIHLDLNGAALEGFSVKIALLRQDN